MGTASVSCAPPCTCTALESLDSFVPLERVSVTRLRAVRLARGGGEDALGDIARIDNGGELAHGVKALEAWLDATPVADGPA